MNEKPSIPNFLYHLSKKKQNFNIEHLYIFTYPDEYLYVLIGTYIKQFNKLTNIYLLEYPENTSGCNGFNWAVNILSFNSKLNKNHFKPIPIEFDKLNIINTYVESISVCNFCKLNNITELGFISVSFHIPRAFLSLTSVIHKEHNTKLNIYPYLIPIPKSNYTILHSQGTLKGNKKKLFIEEIKKIKKYIAKGDLLPLFTL